MDAFEDFVRNGCSGEPAAQPAPAVPAASPAPAPAPVPPPSRITLPRAAGIGLPDKNILILLRNDNKTKPSLIRTVSPLKTLRLTFTVLSTLTETDLTFLFQ